MIDMQYPTLPRPEKFYTITEYPDAYCLRPENLVWLSATYAPSLLYLAQDITRDKLAEYGANYASIGARYESNYRRIEFPLTLPKAIVEQCAEDLHQAVIQLEQQWRDAHS